MLALLGVVLASEDTQDLLVMQVRMVCGVPPSHPHWQSPWFREGGCVIPIEPSACITSGDYAWLVKRHSEDWEVWLAASADNWDDPESDLTPVAIRLREAPIRAEYATTAGRLARDRAAPRAALLAADLLALPWPRALPGLGRVVLKQPLTTGQAQSLLATIRQGESIDRDNAYWPLMRMTVGVQAGDVSAALAALQEVQWLSGYDDYERWMTEAIMRAWQPYGVPRIAAASRRLSASSGTLRIAAALELLITHAALRERAGDAATSDAVYAAVLEVGHLALYGSRDPDWDLMFPVREMDDLRREVLKRGKTVDLLDVPRLTEEQEDTAQQSFARDLARRHRADLAHAVVSCARDAKARHDQWLEQSSDSDPVFERVEIAFLIWWLQVLLLAGSGWLLAVAGGLTTVARSAQKEQLRWRGSLAAVVTVAFYGAYVIFLGVRTPPYGLLSDGGEGGLGRVLDLAWLVILWLLPIGAGLLCLRVVRKTEVPATMRKLHAARTTLVRLALLGFVLVLTGTLYQAYAYRAAERMFPPW
jgi:hypothetical protein